MDNIKMTSYLAFKEKFDRYNKKVEQYNHRVREFRTYYVDAKIVSPLTCDDLVKANAIETDRQIFFFQMNKLWTQCHNFLSRVYRGMSIKRCALMTLYTLNYLFVYVPPKL